MRPKDAELASALFKGLQKFESEKLALPGIKKANYRETLIEQFVESVHRVKYARVLAKLKVSERRTDPSDDIFDPLRAAVFFHRKGNLDEAIWLVFLFVHFGRHRGRYIKEVYGKLGGANRWTWEAVSNDPKAFRKWLKANRTMLERPGAGRGFGNHRKYETLDADSDKGTGAAVETYVAWVGAKSHKARLKDASEKSRGDPHKAFDALYRSMKVVRRFGRLARFDFLTMLGKLGLANIEPGSTYMIGATGPAAGAALLFGQGANSAHQRRLLDAQLLELDKYLDVGMQVLEDALCNWEKSPGKFKPFRG